MIYVWVIFPLVCEGFSLLSPKAANVAFALIIVGFAACVTASYLELKLLGEVLGSTVGLARPLAFRSANFAHPRCTGTPKQIQ